VLAYSTIFSRVIKHNFYNAFYIVNEVNYFIKWLGLLFLNLKLFLNIFFKSYYFKFKNNIYILKALEYFIKNLKAPKNVKFIYFWETMNYRDESFLRYKSVIHWFGQVYNLLTY